MTRPAPQSLASWIASVPTPPAPFDPAHVREGYTAEELRSDLLRAGCSDQYEGKPIDAHGLRRTYGTALGDAEIPLDIRKILMGLRSSTVILSTHLIEDVEAICVWLDSQ